MDEIIEGVITPATEFRIFSGLLKASQGADGAMRLHGVASSTTRDLHGDVMTESALTDMERAANNNLTIFLNHSYNVPEDVGGSVERAAIKTRGADQNGDPNRDLEVDIRINDTNPRAVDTWQAINKGTKLGLSIGAMIPEGGAKRQKNGSYIIEHVDLLETSLVGIPANPRSWVDYAAKALRLREKATTTQLGNPTLTLDGGRYKIEGQLDGLDLNLDAGEQIPMTEAETFPEEGLLFEAFPTGKYGITRFAEEGDTAYLSFDPADPGSVHAATEMFGKDIVDKATVWVETRDGDKITIGDEPAPSETTLGEDGPEIVAVLDAACPECGGSKGSPKGGCDNGYHASAEPDITDAKIRVIEVDTDDQSSDGGSAQEAPSSEPGNADDTFSAPEADVTAEGEPNLEEMTEDIILRMNLRSLQGVARLAISELAETRRALIKAERERDETVEAAANILTRTSAVLEQVSSIPFPRKAVLRDAQREYASIEGYYGEEFAKFLRDQRPNGR